MEEGGLEVKDIRKFNGALLAKWKWRLVSEERGKWKDILISKYGAESCRHQMPKKYQSWCWRDLSKVCGEGNVEGWFKEALVWKLGVGDKVRFWKDVWLGNNKLISLYLRLHFISLDKGLKVGEVGEWKNSVWK